MVKQDVLCLSLCFFFFTIVKQVLLCLESHRLSFFTVWENCYENLHSDYLLETVCLICNYIL